MTNPELIVELTKAKALFQQRAILAALGVTPPKIEAAKKDDTYRDPTTGQYGYWNKFDRLCVCGHTLSMHCAGGFECDIGDPNAGNTGCRCQKFKPSRKKNHD